MFFQTPGNLKKIGNHEALSKHMEGKSEPEIVEYILDLLNSLYADEPIIQNFIDFVKRNRMEVFLYLRDGEVEKTSNIAEQHFSIMSWLFKNRFKTREGLLRTLYWYPHYLSTGMRQHLLNKDHSNFFYLSYPRNFAHPKTDRKRYLGVQIYLCQRRYLKS